MEAATARGLPPPLSHAPLSPYPLFFPRPSLFLLPAQRPPSPTRPSHPWPPSSRPCRPARAPPRPPPWMRSSWGPAPRAWPWRASSGGAACASRSSVRESGRKRARWAAHKMVDGGGGGARATGCFSFFPSPQPAPTRSPFPPPTFQAATSPLSTRTACGWTSWRPSAWAAPSRTPGRPRPAILGTAQAARPCPSPAPTAGWTGARCGRPWRPGRQPRAWCTGRAR